MIKTNKDILKNAVKFLGGFMVGNDEAHTTLNEKASLIIKISYNDISVTREDFEPKKYVTYTRTVKGVANRYKALWELINNIQGDLNIIDLNVQLKEFLNPIDK